MISETTLSLQAKLTRLSPTRTNRCDGEHKRGAKNTLVHALSVTQTAHVNACARNETHMNFQESSRSAPSLRSNLHLAHIWELPLREPALDRDLHSAGSKNRRAAERTAWERADKSVSYLQQENPSVTQEGSTEAGGEKRRKEKHSLIIGQYTNTILLQ